MRVKEWKGTVVFLHEVAEGSAGRSWGVHVAELAGVPAPVVRRAASLMAAMEKQGGPLAASASLRALPLFAASAPQDEADDRSPTESSPLTEALRDMNPDTMTPKQALEALYHLKSLTPPCADDPA
jgi:DNA mismatch repair protein MutS